MPARRLPDQHAVLGLRRSRRKATAPQPYPGTRVDRVGVVVPVHDEEQALRQCLDALVLAAARIAVPVAVVVVLDACSDGSADVAARFAGGGVRSIAVDANSVGFARATGMTELVRRSGESGTWLATTDGDSLVPPNWFTAQLRHVGAGARVVAGTIDVDDWGDRSSAVREQARRDYHATPHRHVHGANLSFAATAYRAAGGFPSLTSDEDVQLVRAFSANAEPITWATDLPVVTSARRDARAPRGFASYLSALEDSVHASGRS